MAGNIHFKRGRGPWPRLSKILLIVALVATVGGRTRTLAHDGSRDSRDHTQNGREEHDDDGRGPGGDWPTIGHDPADTRSQPSEHRIRPGNVSRLRPKWVATTAGDVSATPAVVNGAVYFGDFGGMLWKLDAETGKVIWSHRGSDYTG